jgi:lipopolysaccharide transport system ATP-binding protein
MSSDLITAQALAKTYLIYPTPAARLWQMLWRGKRHFYTPFEALKPLSFTLQKGETVGIVGRNGSGKSTLLQLLAGTLTATSGTLEVRGKVAALLELGAGFNAEFTGRENVYLNGSILGMSRTEIDAAYAEIAAFAGIGDFIDRPVSTYSSGMVVRLAFAVATASRPDILIVDEALSVGDEAFQRKCFARIEKMREAGTTILFVSHSAQTVIQLCDRALWLDAGQLQMDGAPKQVIDAYHKALNAGETSEKLTPSESLHEYPPMGGHILNPSLTAADGTAVANLEHGKRYQLSYDLQLEKPAENLRCGMLIKTRTGVEVAGAVQMLADQQISRVEAGKTLRISFQFTCLLYPGNYFLNCGVMGEVEGKEIYLHRLVDAFAVQVLNPSGRNAQNILLGGLVDLDFAGKTSETAELININHS